MGLIKKILIIDFTNFEDYPIGGYLTFAKNLMEAFGKELALVGITTSKDDLVGKWFKKVINGSEYDFFALARFDKTKTKHFIPDRLMCFILLRCFKKSILQKNFQNVFIQRQEILPALSNFGYRNICYRFPGLENPLKISKYWFGKYASKGFDRLFFSSFKQVNLILASGDEESIQEMLARSKFRITRQSVIKFPTRINTDIFKPIDKKESRRKLNIPLNPILISTVGRLTWLKGWKFMIDSFILFEREVPGSLFCFVGEGEDINKIDAYLTINSLKDKVLLAGKKSPEEISLYLNASDLYIMGSYKEGWPTSLLEAVACGIPVCVTNFGAASEIIIDNVNGFIEKDRDPRQFVKLMQKALNLKIKNIKVSNFSIKELKNDLMKYWLLE